MNAPDVITAVDVYDIRFPTSRELDGSDAMNPDPDYSVAYVVIRTTAGDGHEGHGFTFTIGRGNELCVAAVEALAPAVVGLSCSEAFDDMGAFWKRVTGDSQLRWLGPEKGVIHLATAAIVNAMWDLFAKREEKPLWRLIADMSPEDVVACVDFRYISDALTPDEALELLASQKPHREEREQQLLASGYPGYTTSAGWLGYSDDKIRRLCQAGVDDGWEAFKLKVGKDRQDDLRRARIMREAIGPDRAMMLDANQCWDVDEAIERMAELAEVEPLFIEEPTSPDDILGHATIAKAIAPVGVATGEHAHNRVMFKQLLQADAITHCQIDSARLGGVNEVLAVLLLAAKFETPVWPHAGGVGLCEYVQHLSIIDYLCISGELDGRRIEYVDHLHEHFLDPVIAKNGAYQVPTMPGYSAQMKPGSLAAHAYPSGPAWSQPAGES